MGLDNIKQYSQLFDGTSDCTESGAVNIESIIYKSKGMRIQKTTKESYCRGRTPVI